MTADPAQSAPSAEPDMLQKLLTLNGLPCATETAAYISIRKALGAVASVLVEREKTSIEAQLQDSYHTEIKLHNETLDKLTAAETRAETAESALREARESIEELIWAGSQMANMMFNISQMKERVPVDSDRMKMNELRTKWDKYRALLTVAAQTPPNLNQQSSPDKTKYFNLDLDEYQ